MTTARAVIGANFGDEGKGLVVDYLCSKGAGVVVRFNGGAQAGHTVVDPDGRRHVFKHVGSGAFLGIPTFLSHFFVCNPLMFLQEIEALNALGVAPVVHAHPRCRVTTFADMLINQAKEDARGDGRHGSVGVGVHETMVRSEIDELRITMADLWNGVDLEPTLREICSQYAAFRTGKAIDNPDAMISAYITACQKFANLVSPAGIGDFKDIVFEGAQGLLLDQDRKEFFPHVTHSNTGMKNVITLCASAGIDRIDAYYVTRSYLTRHGAGPLPDENAMMSFTDKTNAEHPYQGKLRFAPLDDNVRLRCAMDRHDKFSLVVTHCDQMFIGLDADYRSYGETRKDISLVTKGL